MKVPWVILALAVMVIGGLTVFTANPVLYIPAKDPAVSSFHQNPAVFWEAAINSTNDVIPLMQDVIDRQEPIAVSLRANTSDTLARDLARYDRSSISFQNKLAQYNIKGGEIAPFLKNTENQRAHLHDLVRQSEALNGLMAAQKKAGDDQDAQATIASQTMAVRESQRSLLSLYLGNCSAVLGVSARIGLDTGSYEQARNVVRGMLVELETAPEVPPVTLPQADAGRITLLMEPSAAVYGDTVQVYGIVTPPQKNQSVVIFLDNVPYLTGTIDATGNYYSRFMVEKITAGNHSIAVTSGNVTSPRQLLAIQATATSTTLNAAPGFLNKTETGVYCDGTVTAAQPVRNATVLILADGNAATTMTTAEDGTYQGFISLPEGGHTITAQFTAEGYPLEPSSSNPVSVEVPAKPIQFTDMLAVGVIVFLILGAALFWLSRQARGAGATGPEPEDIFDGLLAEKGPPLPPEKDELPPEIGTLYARYQAILREQGLSTAARKAYLDLAARIAVHLRLPAYRTLTPRELSGACTRKSYAGIVDIFVDSYERIRYAGSTKRQDQTGFEQELKAADTETGRKQP